MRKDVPSRTAYKVAIGLITLSVKPGMEEVLPKGIVEATEKLFLAAKIANEKTLRRVKTERMLAVYNAFDWMLPGQFEAFAYRKAYIEEKVRKAIAEGAKAKGHTVIIGGELFSDAMGMSGYYEGTYIGMIDHNVTTIASALGGEAPEKGLNGELSH